MNKHRNMRINPLAQIISCLLVAQSAANAQVPPTAAEIKTVRSPIDKTGVEATTTTTTTKSDTVTPSVPTRVDTTTTTTTTETITPLRTTPPPGLRGRPLGRSIERSVEVSTAQITPERIRADHRLAKRLAKSHWLEKAVEADPKVISAITSYRDAAKILAAHPRLGQIAEADHYLCRQITRWKGAAHVLAKNPEAQRVIYYDPEGIYQAIRRDRGLGRRLVRNTTFAQMMVDNPDLSKMLASYI